MKPQNSIQLKREKTYAVPSTSSMELMPATFLKENRKRSVDTFKQFENSLSKLNINSRSASRYKINP